MNCRLATMIEGLPPDLQQEVEDFVVFVERRRARKPGGRLRQDWGGALKDVRDQFTSIELQKKTLEWRGV